MDLKGGYILLPQPIDKNAENILKKANLEIVKADNASIDTVRQLIKHARGIVLRTGINITRELINLKRNLHQKVIHFWVWTM